MSELGLMSSIQLCIKYKVLHLVCFGYVTSGLENWINHCTCNRLHSVTSEVTEVWHIFYGTILLFF